MTKEDFPDCKRKPRAYCLDYHCNFCEDPSGCNYATQFENLRKTGMPLEEILTEIIVSRITKLKTTFDK